MARPQRNPPTGGLILIRLALGVLLFSRGWSWMTSGGLDGLALRDRILALEAESGTLLAAWGDFVLWNPDAHGFLLRTLSLLCGLFLILGIFSRPVGVLAGLICLEGWFLSLDPWEGWVYLLLALMSFACSLSAAGRRFGLDAMVEEQLPSWLTWSRRRSDSLFP